MWKFKKTIIFSTAILATTIGSIGNIAAQAESQPTLPNVSSEATPLLPTDSEAARFLAQATFGPTLADIAHLRTIGYQAWLDEQFTAPVSLEVPYLVWLEKLDNMDLNGGTVRHFDDNRRLESWLINAIGGPDPSPEHFFHSDQLRQRVAFALSELFVVSAIEAKLSSEMWGLALPLPAGTFEQNFLQLLEPLGQLGERCPIT